MRNRYSCQLMRCSWVGCVVRVLRLAIMRGKKVQAARARECQDDSGSQGGVVRGRARRSICDARAPAGRMALSAPVRHELWRRATGRGWDEGQSTVCRPALARASRVRAPPASSGLQSRGPHHARFTLSVPPIVVPFIMEAASASSDSGASALAAAVAAVAPKMLSCLAAA